MASLSFDFDSEYLCGNTKIHIILPNKPREVSPEAFYDPTARYKALWLLHGTFGDCSDWLRYSNIELYACEHDLAVIMPGALNSAYTNWKTFAKGYFMEDFVIQELMPLVYQWFPVSDKREDNFIAGLSMGGTGTMRFAVNYPEKFAAAACLSSSARDYETLLAEQPDKPRFQNLIRNAGGVEEFMASPFNVRRTLQRMADEDTLHTLPRLHLSCGTADHGYDHFQDFLRFAKEIGLQVQVDTLPGYAHEWRFWEIEIQKAIAFFGLGGQIKGNAF